jgi:hypothetical protein
MSDAIVIEPPPDADTSSPRSPQRWLRIIGVVVAVLAVGGVAAAVVIANNDDSPDCAAPQIGWWMHQGCEQWADSYEGANGPNTAWCNSMAGWRDGRMGNTQMMGQGQMMGSKMWQDPASMRTTCEQWMTANPDAAPGGADTIAWCVRWSTG